MRLSKPASKLASATIACTVGVALLVGGSTYALWTANAPANTQASITTGDLRVTALAQQKWTDVTKTASPVQLEDLSDFRMAPGDVLQLKQDLNVIVVGDNISGVLDVSLPNDTASQAVLSQAVFTLAVLDKSGVEIGSITPKVNTVDALKLSLSELRQTVATGETYTVKLTVALPKTADNAVKNQVIALSNTAITLRQGAALKPLVIEPKANAAEDFTWAVSAGQAIITGYKGTSSSVVIPKTYMANGVTVPVTTIYKSAFQGKLAVTSLVIPDSVTDIQSSAFAGTGITSLVIPDSVTSIGDRAFNGSRLTSVKLPKNISEIKEFAFYNTKLTSVTIPSKVKVIGGNAFALAPITSFYMEGNAPVLQTVTYLAFGDVAPNKIVYHKANATGYGSTWYGFTTAIY
jgi:alternate signal-mediated exported protein